MSARREGAALTVGGDPPGLAVSLWNAVQLDAFFRDFKVVYSQIGEEFRSGLNYPHYFLQCSSLTHSPSNSGTHARTTLNIPIY